MKPKILLATPIYPPEIGGPATYTKELIEKLKNDFEITVLTYGDKNKSPLFDGSTLHIIDKNKSMPVRLMLYTIKLLSLARKVDVIYVQNAVAAGLPVAIASTILRKPFILKFVGDEAWERATQRKETTKFLEDFLNAPEGGTWIKMLRTIQGFVLRRASIVTTPSAYLGELLVKNYGVKQERMITNYNASETEDRELPFTPEKKSHQIVATARLTKWKGVDGILEAVKILKDKYADVSFVVAGDGPELENLQKQAKDLGVAEYVKFLGRVSREETYKLRKESTVYVLNSTYEGLPHTALTSFQAQIPIVATDTPGTNEAVYDNVSGLLVPMNDSVKLAEAISRLFDDSALRDKLVAGGTKILHEKFSWESHIKNLKTFFRDVVKKV